MESQAPFVADRSSLLIDIDSMKKDWLPDRFRMHRVSPQLRMKQGQYNDEPSVYDPLSVSLGPYHHGKEEFSRAEEFKHLCLHWCAGGDDSCKIDLYEMILNTIDLVRDCYGDVSVVNKYNDDALARMMLLDACFIINFMRIRASDEIAKDSYNCLGVAAAHPFAARDIMVLENQIPFFVLELVLLKVSTDDTVTSLLEGFMIEMLSVDRRYAIIPREDEARPLHLLEACRRVLLETPEIILHHKMTPKDLLKWVHVLTSAGLVNAAPKDLLKWVHVLTSAGLVNAENKTKRTVIVKEHYTRKRLTGEATEGNTSYASKGRSNYITCPSVTYLKTKGIQCHPSSSHFLTDINFDSHAYGGKLQLPVCYASNLTFVFLSNMIAYEIAPGNVDDSPDLTVLSYVCLMKSLIQTPADVMELQNKGILRLNRFANHEQVVHMYKSFETFNLRNVNIYQKVMFEIGEHCTCKSKTWMADLIHLKFKNPWTVVALLSATILLILTFLQTLFTIRPYR